MMGQEKKENQLYAQVRWAQPCNSSVLVSMKVAPAPREWHYLKLGCVALWNRYAF